MSQQTIYDTRDLMVTYDNEFDVFTITDMHCYNKVPVGYFVLEEIMENARKAHVMRNNLRMEEEE